MQKGEVTEETPKPPRASLPKGWSPESIDLERALLLLNLPRAIGPHPEDGVLVEAGIGRFGPYVKHDKVYANLPDVEEVFTIGMNRAVEVLAQKASRGAGRGGAAAQPLRELGEHPEGGAISVMPGRYGPYVKWEKVNATLPKDVTPEAVTLEEALALITEKAGKKPARKPAAKAVTKTATKAASKAGSKSGAAKSEDAPARKAATKPASKTAKKPAAKKPAAKKATEVADDVLE